MTTMTANGCGGYSCEFVEPPPSAFQTECPICLQILKEPCLTSCCGHKFCSGCIERARKGRNPCPVCSEPEFTIMRERWLERCLKQLEVWCSYEKDGCEWRGKLGELEVHLNQDPSTEDQLIGCLFADVECTHKCGERLQRRHITTHVTQQCKKRPFCCDYCLGYHSTFEDVTELHYPQCSKYPVSCPNCQMHPFKREELDTHLHDQCPLALTDCPFSYVGCEAQLPRRDLPDHMRETVTHLTLLATYTQQLQQSLKEKDRQYRELELNHQTTEQSVRTLREEACKLQVEVQTLREETRKLKMWSPGFPVDFCLEQSSDDMYSPPFYTHPHGYRMCVQVYPKGHGKGLGSHMSIFTRLMQGPFDDYLEWPFRGDVMIQLVNQAGDHDHIERTIHYTDKTPDEAAGRVSGRERSKKGWGVHKVIACDALYDTAQGIEYSKHNRLLIRVIRVA